MEGAHPVVKGEGAGTRNAFKAPDEGQSKVKVLKNIIICNVCLLSLMVIPIFTKIQVLFTLVWTCFDCSLGPYFVQVMVIQACLHKGTRSLRRTKEWLY